MKYLLKKYWYIITLSILINLPLVLISTIKEKKSLCMKGDTTIFSSVVEVDTDYEIKGSFSTVFVYTYDYSTVLQNIVAKHLESVEVSKMSYYESHLSAAESNLAGKIMYDTSINNAMIVAYTEAQKINPAVHIDYEYSGYKITNYAENSKFAIGDLIYGIKYTENIDGTNVEKYVEASNEEEFRKVASALKIGYICKVKTKDNQEKEVTLVKGEGYSYYDLYTINYDTLSPSVKRNSNDVQGPSGGLLQALSIYNCLIEEDITYGKKIAGTGTINYKGQVGAIGGIKEKVPTALDDKMAMFLCPEANYEDALKAYNSLPNRYSMKLVKVSTFKDALEALKELKDE